MEYNERNYDEAIYELDTLNEELRDELIKEFGLSRFEDVLNSYTDEGVWFDNKTDKEALANRAKEYYREKGIYSEVELNDRNNDDILAEFEYDLCQRFYDICRERAA